MTNEALMKLTPNEEVEELEQLEGRMLAHPAKTRLITDARSTPGLQSDTWHYR
jgi:hypothetical protein